MKKLIMVGILGLLLVGCAVEPERPRMNYMEYQECINKCGTTATVAVVTGTMDRMTDREILNLCERRCQ